MGINLTLVVDPNHRTLGGTVLGYTRFSLQWQNYRAFDQLRAEAIPLQVGLWWYGDDGVKVRSDDAYGSGLTWLPAHSVARYLAAAQLRPFDAACLAYLNALPADTMVVLWWH